ncbi:MAG: alanine racemase [Candidatus Nephthysia bennettiae]|nr:MAG: alanine racemase [Candidatus Dormibacteraeota bacterium]
MRCAEVDLTAVRHNVRYLQGRLADGIRLIAVVKADGYGHGAEEVARAALEAGAWGLAVSTLEEAAAFRGTIEPDRLLALGGLAPNEAVGAASAGCAVTCHSHELADALESARGPGDRLPVHLKVDTGMGRLGCSLSEAGGLARRLSRSSRLRLAGIYTHLASAEADEAFTRDQFDRFSRLLDGLDVDPGLRHAANSAAALRYPEMGLDAVRCGIALYGCEWPGLRAALSLRATIIQVKELSAGHSVGYGRTWVAERPTRVATVAIGYEDGVLRSRSGRGEVVVRGRRAPLIGRVSMDQITVDVTEVPEAKAGDTVTLVGKGISAEQVAEWSGTISYEVLTALGGRVRRVYRE